MIDKEFIKNHCEKVNEKHTNTLGDKLIIDTFNGENSYNPSLQTHFLRVALIDYLWSTSLNRYGKNIYDISEKIRNSLMGLKGKISQLSSQDLFELELNQTDRETIKECIKKIMGCCGHKRGIVFPCKYLHFLKPTLFIPWDSLVPKAIMELQEIQIDTHNPLENGYFHLIEGYKQIYRQIKEVSSEDIREIIEYDYETQKPYQSSRKNTFIRLIDKSLWGYKKYGN